MHYSNIPPHSTLLQYYELSSKQGFLSIKGKMRLLPKLPLWPAGAKWKAIWEARGASL